MEKQGDNRRSLERVFIHNMKYFWMILETKLLKNEKHQTRVSLLLELVSDAYLTANRTRYIMYLYISHCESNSLHHVASSIRSEICITDEL